jgi:hypothetical protein
MSRLVWILPELKRHFGGKFYITPAVRKELVERPLSIKRFEFEALQVEKLINDGVLEIYDKVPQKIANQLVTLANSAFSINNNAIDVIQSGELESVSCVLDANAEGVVMDERTLRLLIENGPELETLLERRFNSDVIANQNTIKQFMQITKNVKIIRSIELVAVAYKLGLLDSYIPNQPDGKEVLLDSVLWAVKYNGCAVMDEEIEDIKNYLLNSSK